MMIELEALIAVSLIAHTYLVYKIGEKTGYEIGYDEGRWSMLLEVEERIYE